MLKEESCLQKILDWKCLKLANSSQQMYLPISEDVSAVTWGRWFSITSGAGLGDCVFVSNCSVPTPHVADATDCLVTGGVTVLLLCPSSTEISCWKGSLQGSWATNRAEFSDLSWPPSTSLRGGAISFSPKLLSDRDGSGLFLLLKDSRFITLLQVRECS